MWAASAISEKHLRPKISSILEIFKPTQISDFERLPKTPATNPFSIRKTKWNSTAYDYIYYPLLSVLSIIILFHWSWLPREAVGAPPLEVFQIVWMEIWACWSSKRFPYAWHMVGIKWSLMSLPTHPFCDHMIVSYGCLSRQGNILIRRSTTSTFRWPKNDA